ncbi:7TM diverse intracellular signaling domain-containing protein [Arcobacter arenosus]|uniref:7TM diverse intracellular signaling domain-containing protein n=1 Tax=Arcobacter arenosus TaxID=2576037 RepID=UPI001BB1AC12|nr:7TM diverse intracellular signaling domain-containing protein [Arcobacter arenosus]
MKFKLLILLFFFSFLNAEYLVYEDINGNKTLDYIKKNKHSIFKKTNKPSFAATQSTIWLSITLKNDLKYTSSQYIRFREAFLYKIELYDENNILKGGSSVSFKNKQLPYVTDTFKVELEQNSSKTVFIKILPKYNATYAYDIFKSYNEVDKHNDFYENVFMIYLSIMTLILISALIIFFIFREKLFIYYIYFIFITIIFQVYHSGYILMYIDIPNLVKYAEILALGVLIGSTLFIKKFFKEQVKKYPFSKFLFQAILIMSSLGIILLLFNFSYYVDLFIELVIINFGLISLILFVLYMIIKKVKYSLFIFIGMFTFINTSMYCALYFTGIIDTSYGLVSMQIGSIIESFAFLSLILFRIYNRIRIEKNKSEEYAQKLKEMQILAKMGIWTYNIINDTLHLDESSKKIYEVDKDVISFKHFLNLIHPDDRKNMLKIKKQALSRQDIHEFEFRLILNSDISKLKYISIHWQFSYDYENKLSHINGYIINKTEKVLAQKKLENQQLLIMHQQKLAQQGEILSMIAHQWRQPLTALSATTNALILKNMVGKEINSDELYNELKLISTYTNHLSSTIDDFRNFFKAEKEKTTVSFEELADKSLNIIKLSLETNDIKIFKNYNCKKKFSTYENEVRQVILNIFKNAEDVLIERKIEDKKIFIETKEENNYIVLSINDNAGGIKEELLSKIFEAYFSTKKNKDGTGLGLYMSRTIINKHCNGKLEASNNKYGAVFTIKIPKS